MEDTRGSAVGPEDACQYIAPSELQTLLGMPFGAGEHVTPDYVKTCTWQPSAGGSGLVQYVTLSFQPGATYAQAKAMLRGPVIALSPVSGIGTDAYFSSVVNRYMALNVTTDSAAFEVAIYGKLAPKRAQSAEKTIAAEVISKL
jgi:hypothetical protein